NSEIHGFIPAGRRYHEGSVEGKKERVITSLKSENFSLRSCSRIVEVFQIRGM
ncbi:hypothetical protein HID58_042487, partial [Brassica napus]